MSTIVISGFSGRFPECDNTDELREKLFAGEDLVTEDARRWLPGLHGLPGRNGKLKDLAGFDAKFFGVHPRQASAMDPGLRILLENTYEAIVDAGYNPEELRGKKIGVYVGQTLGEALDNLSRDPETLVGYGMSGSNRAMTSNRISFTFDFRGPSYTVDTACSSSLFALDQAVKAMEEGHISAALVGGVNMLLSPSTSLYFHRLNMLSEDGACKAFDASGKGYVRSEATGMLFLQKYEDARRVYATVVKTGTNADGYKDQGITYPSGASQKTLIEDVFRSIDVSPSQVSYVEAHGTGTKAGDPEELNTVDSVFCAEPRATGPLLVGSVKSNLGHSEGSAGICQVAKVLIAMEEGAIPQTLHFKEPNPNIPGLANGNLQVVDKNLPWSGGYAAVNSFGFGGANAHVVLKSHDKNKILQHKTNLPTIVTCSGTTQEAVSSLLARANEFKEDDELVGLLHVTYRRNIPGHNHRGFSILGKTEEDVEESTTKRDEVWFVFSGMGSQWVGMGRRLTVFQPFSRGLEKCADALKTVGVDLMDIINNCEESSLHVLNSFICITSIQVALVDLLTALGVRPDGMVGHSVGELGCAYADGTFTAEQAVLAAHARGKSILDCKLPVGAMAAVAGLSWDEVKSKLPADVFAACNNAEDSVTISGEAHAVEKCVVDLKSQGINVREVNSSGVGFHSKCIAPAGPALRKALMKIVPDPKPRSSKWISTCVPESSWNEPWAQSSSAEYHTHNLLSPVLFKEGMEKIPAGSVVIEIAPHALLSGLLRKSIKGSHVVPLTKKGIPDEVNFSLNSLGKLYNAGIALDLAVLYPKVKFPVGRGTPMIAPAVKWDHTTKWHVPIEEHGKGSAGFIKEVDLKKDDAFIHGHTIDGRVLYPATGYLILVWKAFAKKLGRTFESLQVEIEDVNLHQATILSKEGSVKLAVSILSGSGEFELTQGNSVIVTGRIKESAGLGDICPYMNRKKSIEPKVQLNSDDIYKELKLRGYEYTGEFQGVKSSDLDGAEGLLEWSGNWITFMDTMLQFDIIGKRTRELFLPTRFTKIIIDPLKHLELAKQNQDFQVYSNKNLSLTRSGGVEIRNLKTSHVRRRITQQKPKHEEHVFVPYINNKTMTRENALTAALQIVMENMESSLKIKILELGRNGNVLCPTIGSILKNQPSVIADITLATKHSPEEIVGLTNDIKLISKDFRSVLESGGHNLLMSATLLGDNQLLTKVAQSMTDATFLLCEERIGVSGTNVDKNLELISKFDTGESSVFVYRQARKWTEPDVIPVSNKHFKWVTGIRKWLETNRGSNKKLLVVSQGEPDSGILGLIRCLRLEDSGKSIRSLMLSDTKGDFVLDHYLDQLKKDLCMNVLRNGAWGSMRHLAIDQNALNRVSTPHAYVNTLVRGDLSSLEWIQGPLTHSRKHLNPDKELCSVYYAPLNFRDIMLATGKLPPDALPGNLTGQDCILGLEFSGRDIAGRRVMGIVEACGLATTVAADEGFLWSVPPSWSLEQAATVPIVYSTAYYALIVRGKLRSGESVLIHAGSGGVGLAAISIALHLGCQVFTTVSSPQKRAFLKDNFPQLSDSVICNSRDTSFEQKVLSQTDGQGVDVVLNSLAGELLQSSVRCLAKHGRFLEIGKADLSNNSPLGMSVFLRNTTVHGILLDALFTAGKDDPEKAAVVQLMREGIDSGQVQPLPATVFKHDQIEQSFRYMATGKHIGKVVLQIREEEKRSIFEPRKHLVPAIARSYMDPDKSYILVGGLGGFGLELADWLVDRGANKLVLTSRSGVATGYQALRVQRWRERGVLVKVSTADCTKQSGAVELMKTAALMGPVGGIYNLAGVLQDAMMEEQSEESFSIVASPKMHGTNCLDTASRVCTTLDHFVVFSSVSCGRGNPGQANYGFANSVMERICEARAKIGIPALAIQWGAIGDVGMVMKDLKGHNDTKVGGTLPQRIASCLNSLDFFLGTRATVVASMVLADKETVSTSASGSLSIADIVGNILGIKDPKTAGNSTLAELGMDSLMGTEIKQTLEINLDIIMTAQEIRGLSFPKLQELSSPSPHSENNTQTVVIDSTEILSPGKIPNAEQKIVPQSSIRKMTSKSWNDELLPVFMVHPVQGTVELLEEIASNVTRPVWGLECSDGAPMESAQALATHYIKMVRSKQPRGPYTILAYSLGSVLGLEMALKLEEEGEKVSLTLLDGSPDFVKGHIGIYFKTQIDKANLDAFRWPYVTMLFTDIDYSKLKRELEELPTAARRMARCSELLNCSEDTFTRAVQLFWRKLEICKAYKPSGKLKSQLRLVKASENFVTNVGSDYDLSQYCELSVEVITIAGTTHPTIVAGKAAEQVAHLLNAGQ